MFERDGTQILEKIEDLGDTVKENGYFVDYFEIHYDYDIKTNTHFYYTLTNVLASLGGVLALAGGVIGQLTTFITFSFFW